MMGRIPGALGWITPLRPARPTQAIGALTRLGPNEAFRILLVFRVSSCGAVSGMTSPQLAQWAHPDIDTREETQRTCSPQHPVRSHLGFDAMPAGPE